MRSKLPCLSLSCYFVVQSLNSTFLPPHIGAEPRAGERRVQDNLHTHAQNEPIKNYQVRTTLLASMCRAMPFSARALKENICFDVDIVIKKQKKLKLKYGLSWSVLLSTTSTRHCSFPKHFSVLFLYVERFYKSF